MRIYRYEKSDGGGPYFTLNGKLRAGDLQMNDNYLNGCDSLDNLQLYFQDKQDILQNCHIEIYNIPDKEIIVKRNHTVLFPKKYQKPVSTISDECKRVGCEISTHSKQATIER